MGAGGRYGQHRLETLTHIAGLFRATRPAEFDHVQTETALAAVVSLAGFAFLAPRDLELVL